MVVMFDLPVVLKQQRQEAMRFRLTLLDLGFEMTQFSVYMRFCTSQAHVDTFSKKVEGALPPGGKVNIITFTDKQYERILSFHGRQRMSGQKTPDQFDLF